jgi:hypothetical protein
MALAVVAFAPVAAASPALDPGRESADPGLTVRGGFRARPGEREVYGMVTLSLPLASFDRLLGAEPGRARPGTPAVLAQGPEPETARSPLPVAREPLVTRVELTVRLAREAVRVALRVAGVPEARARLGSIGSRVRVAALAPDVRVRGGRTTDESLRWTPTDADPYRYNQAGGTRLYVEVELGWKLGRLIFEDAEFRVEELRRQRVRAEREIVEQVLGALFEWQKARLRSTSPDLSEDQRAEAWITMVRAASELDLLTDGWFGRHTRAVSEPH